MSVSAGPRSRAPFEHTTLPKTAEALPSMAVVPVPMPASPQPAQGISHRERHGTSPTYVPSPPAPAEPRTGSGVFLIVSAVVLALLILGGAFWYRAHDAQVRHEQEIEQRLRDLRR